MAHAVGRELGLQAEGTFSVAGHPVLLQLALRNLVENALHHTPPGTQVEVQVDAAGRWVQVRDEAPVPAAAAPVVSPPTGLGLGLGHRVVEKIAAIHGARFERLPVERGTCFRISFPTG
jgi:two-component system sensor histidine kinase QseC